ncbi:type III-A CRISPR-associated RAMP protein Csm4 [Campylobacter gastrosuis]|uniref:CRISPR system Cms protein Csm4 n=1 Tax=Campylobacter gastrosuis TaxID=2974576 RepID=A0ABT7HRW9_9BACT|nr:RAMP superfamily CRISPR-associated protein [Campylobacter gastrosuis]MDL0089654.1 hypothetical protein [Campylobacter gastrosuis]
MKLYKTTITPISSFATPLKGDTLFGQICWAIRYIYDEKRLNSLLKEYETKPFLIVSDGFTSGYLPKPTMPSSLLGEDLKDKKDNRKKIWLTQNDLERGNFKNAKKSSEINEATAQTATIKNAINYLKFSTDDSGVFSPYAVIETSFGKQDIYFLLDENFSVDELKKALKLVAIGYGKKASVGKGHFSFDEITQVSFKNEAKAFMTLSPCAFYGGDFSQCYYEPFTRFGKHGGALSNTNPFKAPLLLADTGAVITYEKPCVKDYIGRAIKGHSSHENAVHQGYSIVIATEIYNAI